MNLNIGNDWDNVLASETDKPYFSGIINFLKTEYSQYEIYPPKDLIFSCMKYVPFNDVRVVVVGQDPYINEGQANGLAFAVSDGVALPPSLKNIYAEIETDLGVSMKGKSGDLTGWAAQGVLLLNATLTVRAGGSNTHQNCGWQVFTDHIIKMLGERQKPLVFILWGANARRKAAVVRPWHKIIESAHPSPLSAFNGFFGSKPFSRANQFLDENNMPTIDWTNTKYIRSAFYYTDKGSITKA